jgi:hypothetical protein
MSNCNSNSCNFNYRSNSNCYDSCSDLDNCYDFIIKRHDALPEFKLEVTDCDEPIDLTGLISEASMWSCSKLKSNITDNQTVIQFADNIGFDQILKNTIIQAGVGRNFERMNVVGFDEEKKEIYVERGYKNTTSFAWKKGTNLRLLRFLSNSAITEMNFEDVTNSDGSITKNKLTHSFLVYKWNPEDTCLAGPFFFEFKLIKMFNLGTSMPPIPSYSPCNWGYGIEWTRRFPVDKDGFIIKVYNSPTGE